MGNGKTENPAVTPKKTVDFKYFAIEIIPS